MKNSEEHIDKLFKDKLGDQSFDIPSEFIDDLNSRLDKVDAVNKRKRGGWFILNSLFLLLFISLFFIDFTNHNDRVNIAEKPSNIDKPSTIDSISKSKLDKDNKSLNAKQIIEKKKSEKVKITGKESKLTAENTAFEASNSNFSSSNNAKNKYTQQENNYKKDSNSSEETTSNKEKNTENTSVSSSKESDRKVASWDTVNASPPDTVVVRDTVFVYDTLAVKDTIVVVDTVRIDDSKKEALDNAKLKFDLQLFMGINYGAQQLSQSNSTGSNYFISENPLFTPSFGFNINTSWNNINLGTGIEYFQIGEEYDINSTSVTANDTVEIVGYDYDTVVFNQQTQTFDTIYVPVYDSVTIYDTVTSTNNWLNSYSWLSIPLNLGYRYEIGKWAVLPRAGITFNFGMRNSNGQYPDTNANPVTSIESAPVLFNLDYLLQLEIRRSIGKAELYVSPNLRGSLTPVILDSSNRKYKSFGVRFGVAIPL